MQDEFDVIVIGGGITGAGIARDCALRNLKTLLIEKKDFASGTTGACSGFLHGGPRYLDTDPKVTEESCKESGIIQRLAPNLCFRIPFVLPAFSNIPSCDINKLDEFFSKYDEFAPLKNSNPHIKLSKEELLSLEPNLSDEIQGGVTFDEWGVDVFRLTLLTIVSAVENGAVILNHSQVVKMTKKDDLIENVVVKNEDGKLINLSAKVIVNASGPWVPLMCEMVGVDLKLRPTKGVHLILDRRITNLGVVSIAIDGAFREIFPHENTTLIGCTDDDFFSSPEDIPITRDEVEYILDATARAVPKVKESRVIRAMAGLRPMLYQEGVLEGKVSRDFKLIDHEKSNDIKNFISMTGGKLVIYRLMAEKITDLICKKMGKNLRCITSEIPFLPQQSGHDDFINKKIDGLFHSTKLSISNKFPVFDNIEENLIKYPEFTSKICLCEPVTEAEIRFSINNEWVSKIDDLRRRLRIGTGPCQGYHCSSLIGIILAEEKSLTSKQTFSEIIDFLKERWKGKRIILNSSQIIQEEIAQAKYANIYGFDNFLVRGGNLGF